LDQKAHAFLFPNDLRLRHGVLRLLKPVPGRVEGRFTKEKKDAQDLSFSAPRKEELP
jgi:hypothetical protein